MANAQGWPANYPGVMLQGFYWIEEPAYATSAQKDSIKQEFNSISWKTFTEQADELSEFFSLIWVPQSGRARSNPSMGYDPQYWFEQNSTFGRAGELRTMTATFRQKGTGIIADVVLNHRQPTQNWVVFPNEYCGVDGKYYALKSTDICKNDDGGATKEWADANGYQLSPNNDEGDDFSDARDLDHQSENVQKCVKAYLNFLLTENNPGMGFAGFRLDMVKGYSAYYTGLYNYQTKPQFSVGEYWDSFDNIKNWMDGTRRDANGNYSATGDVQSAAFDFPLKYKIKEACESGNWLALYPNGNGALAWNSYWPRWAVTFVDNHDSYREGYNRCNQNVLAANAYILAMPGTPCIFLPHWREYKQQIKQLIYARKLAGITNQSGFETTFESGQCLATCVNGKLEILMGNGYGVYDASEGTDRVLVESGENYALYLSKSIEAPWLSLPSGSYTGPVNIRATALSNTTQTMVYTLDGTTPTASSTKIENGNALVLNESATLCIGLLSGTKVVNVQTRQYDITPGESQDVTINVYAPNGAPYLYAWDESGMLPNGAWPGTQMTQTTTTPNGTEWYTTNITTLGFANIIFNDGNGAQTANITDLAPDTHYFTYDGATGYKIVSADYVPAPPKTMVTVNVRSPKAPNLYCWTSTGTTLCGAWPGETLTQTVSHNGQTYYTKSLKTEDESINIIFNTSSGQTADIKGLTTGTYYYSYDGATGYELEEVVSIPTCLHQISQESHGNAAVYDMMGRRISSDGTMPQKKGVYVQGGRKIVVK